MNAALKAVEEERDILQNRLQIEIDSRKEMEGMVKMITHRVISPQSAGTYRKVYPYHALSKIAGIWPFIPLLFK